jgi:hypothetical protein
MNLYRFAAGLGLAVALSLSTGCMKTSIAVQPVPGTVNPKNATTKEKAHFFLWGLAGNGTINTAELCPSGVHWIQTQASFVDSLLGGLTFGIYGPRTVAVKCASGSAFMLEPMDGQNATLATLLDADEVAAIEAVR